MVTLATHGGRVALSIESTEVRLCPLSENPASGVAHLPKDRAHLAALYGIGGVFVFPREKPTDPLLNAWSLASRIGRAKDCN